jgi:hypothetical protein
MTKRITIFIAVLLLVITSCGRQQSPLGPDDSAQQLNGGPQTFASGGQLVSARLNLLVGFANGQAVNVHRIVSPWEPATATWNQFAGAYNSDIEGSFTAVANGSYALDITPLVQSWIAGDSDNHGLLLRQPAPGFSPLVISSSENTATAPFLEICYLTAEGTACDTVQAVADVFIDETQPDASSEGSSMLLVGSSMTPGNEKQGLMRFDLLDVVAEAAPVSVGGGVWEDINQDGIKDTDEPALEGVAVRLYDCQEMLLADALSDSAGSYRFDSLTAGSFLVEFVAPDGFVFSPMDQEPGDSLDSDADPTTGRTACFDLAEGEAELVTAAGMYIPVVTDSGCTRSKGYWKNHAGFDRQPDEVSPLLPLWLGDAGGEISLLVENAATAVDVLAQKTYGAPSNGITKLYAQLLAAKLNIAAGALADDVATTIAEADAFLAVHPWTDWELLDPAVKQSVLAWKDQFDLYNNGEIGPGKCD